MIVCIAEKPSVAKDIAQILGAKERKDGYWEGNGYRVTWTFGHLCTLKEPHDYAPFLKYWRIEDLPIIPQQYGIKLIDYQGVKKQFETIERLIHDDCEYVVNCGDAGQEGELIQRWVLLKAKCKAPIKRLWISSLTEEAIKEGFDNLKEASHYDNLYAAGTARAIGDWLLGINATRLYTKQYGRNNTVLSIGRVQTPTLAMIVNRQAEIDAFKSAVYWELKTKYRNVEFTASIHRLVEEERAIKGLAYLKQYPFTVTQFEIKEGKEKCPKLYDLTSLQVDANKKYGYSADQTLKLIQSLYEKKHVTYPRVDTQYLPDDIYPKIPEILQHMHQYQQYTASVLAQPIPKSKNVFDNNKVTDHHAIIPTTVVPNSLPEEEWHIYDLIARRFIAVFYPEAKISNTSVEGKVEQIPFKVTGKQILEPGWKVVYPKESQIKEEDSKEEKEQVLPHFEVGENGPHEPFIHKGKTSPPKYYTEATILRAMETAGKQVDDDQLRELMKDNGIGRPSTRASIIETLFKRKYIEKKKKNIIATPTGIELINNINNELLKSPELTGDWEKKIREIEKGNYNLDTFKEELTKMVSDLVFEVKYKSRKDVVIDASANTTKIATTKTSKAKIIIEELNCPKCKTHKLVKGKTAYGCENFKNCGFKLPFEIYNKKLSTSQLQDLIVKGKTNTIKGLNINNEETSGQITLNEDYEIELKK
jgi:DNA topoisomerase-3